jgi:AbrB family looped-hinge helix DNA binding protein
MIIDLRKKSQITIPKEIVDELNLNEGDHLEVSVKNGINHH